MLAGVIAVAIAASIAGAALTRAARSPAPASSCLRPNAPSTADSKPAAQAPDSGGIQVAEQGFTQIKESKPLFSDRWVSIGAVLANTSAHVAYRTHVVVRMLDKEGRSALAETAAPVANLDIPLIMPGQHIGLGSRLPVHEDDRGRLAKVARVEVTLGSTHWLPSTGDQGLAQVAAHHVRTERDSEYPTDSMTYYSIESTYCEKLFPRGVSVVFRDATGRVVGGSFDGASSLRCDPGANKGQVSTADVLPPNFDGPKTTVSVYCDLQPRDRTIYIQPTGQTVPLPSSEPFN
ncbi:hypothetical protein [Micromonospora zhanjiangensis]|uniref:Uncharacterized protein n=1 Tax=Micromonospora zhanjiangensis TaxID=1522057 RepID=A0ABV8KPQ2_9ACTN